MKNSLRVMAGSVRIVVGDKDILVEALIKDSTVRLRSVRNLEGSECRVFSVGILLGA